MLILIVFDFIRKIYNSIIIFIFYYRDILINNHSICFFTHIYSNHFLKSTTWDSNLSKYSSITLPLQLAIFQKELPLLSSPQLIYINIYRCRYPFPIFIPNFLAQKKLSPPILSKNSKKLSSPPFDTHSSEGARIVRLWHSADGLHGVSTTGTPHRSHTLRNRSFHCPAYTTSRFIILFIATTGNYCPPDLNPRFRFHLRPYREGPDNRPAPGLSPPDESSQRSCVSNNGENS